MAGITSSRSSMTVALGASGGTGVVGARRGPANEPRNMASALLSKLDRCAKTPLAEQISKGIISAIDSGVLLPGARLPSWLDLAAQLGVARGTVRSAYEKLLDAQLVVSSKSTGTRVAERPAPAVLPETHADADLIIAKYRTFFIRSRSVSDRRSCTGRVSGEAHGSDSVASGSRRSDRASHLSGSTRRTTVAARDRRTLGDRARTTMLSLAGLYHFRLPRRPRSDTSRAQS